MIMMIGKESNHKTILKGNNRKMTLQHTFNSSTEHFFALLCKEIVWHMNVDRVIYISICSFPKEMIVHYITQMFYIIFVANIPIFYVPQITNNYKNI